ncbi:hypothetical protein ACHAW5_005292 [Stephanodiscus triporus]|uniref:NTF2-related export protein n=1 Tax=Stephanodiscus triporus TaxID=2934178 RepID=A0ABD3QXV9_9STRA
MSAEEIATAFVQHFYQTFDNGVDSLGGLFVSNSYPILRLIDRCVHNEQSMLTFEGQQVGGSAAIIEKLRSVGSVAHSVKTTDVQPSSNPNAIIIFVTGAIKIGGDNPLHFCEFFHLVSTAPGQYYVHNDVFRLNYGL